MKVHFVGIGGIGVSALAQYYLTKGHQVSGSDLVSSEITDALKKKGVKILIGKHKAKNLLKDVDLVLYSLAVQPDNTELKKARKIGIKIQSYPEALGELTRKYFTIAVSGTHGKSTSAAMVALILIKAGLNPTVIVGTKLKEFGDSNYRVGKSKYLVIEADEWQSSFLNYRPKIIVLTNIEKEHLDFYKNLNDILKTYKKYIGHLPKDGVLVANSDDFNTRKIIRDRISSGDPISLYWLNQRGTKKLKKILKIPGEHNVYNALAALAVARILKIPDKVSFKALSEYKGSWRRFEVKKIKLTNNLKPKTCTLISDYAHHPTEIEATLKAAREKFPRKEIWCVFQPHQYQRTYYLFDDFVKVFKEAPIDRLIITDIYDVAGREEKKIKEKVSSEKLIKTINKPLAIYIPTIKKATDYLKKNLQGGEVVIIMGAGDIYKLCEQF
ncbi:MAG: UDP-N-acetylmuramate--L-alanine ligase [bacterium]|nr:UDP-N-acetylmuramate--L-alanine ligase [bacterium]